MSVRYNTRSDEVDEGRVNLSRLINATRTL